MQSDPVHFLVHVPKCAGTTVELHFARHLGDDFLIAPRSKSFLRDFTGNRASLPGSKAKALKVISGHSLAERMATDVAPQSVLPSVLLREPVSWFLSYFNYQVDRASYDSRRPHSSFEDWRALVAPNPIARFLMRRYFGVGYPRLFSFSSREKFFFLNEKLKDFYFVGDVRHTALLIADISRQMNIPEKAEPSNVTRSKLVIRSDVTDQLVSQIRKYNALDVALHQVWGERLFKTAQTEISQDIIDSLPDNDRISSAFADTSSKIRKRMR